jgi:hypothetical protein
MSSAATNDLLESERNTIEVFRRVAGSVVYVANARSRRGGLFVEPGQVQQGEGSGFVWDELGHIVTNYHVVHGGDTKAQLVEMMFDGAQYRWCRQCKLYWHKRGVGVHSPSRRPPQRVAMSTRRRAAVGSTLASSSKASQESGRAGQ